jgi:hypothetical protein
MKLPATVWSLVTQLLEATSTVCTPSVMTSPRRCTCCFLPSPPLPSESRRQARERTSILFLRHRAPLHLPSSLQTSDDDLVLTSHRCPQTPARCPQNEPWVWLLSRANSKSSVPLPWALADSQWTGLCHTVRVNSLRHPPQLGSAPAPTKDVTSQLEMPNRSPERSNSTQLSWWFQRTPSQALSDSARLR